MACKENSKRKSYTYIWKLENLCHWCCCRFIESPEFTVKEIDNTNWILQLYFHTYLDSNLCLLRQYDGGETGEVEIDYELSYLTSDGTVLHSIESKNEIIGEGEQTPSEGFPSWNEVFFTRRSVTLPHYSLTVRCKIWRSVGEISEDDQLLAHTWFSFEKKSFSWNIQNFSNLKLDDKQTYEIKSVHDGEKLMTLEAFLMVGLRSDEKIRIKISPNSEVKCCNLQISIVDTSKNAVKYIKAEDYDYGCNSIEFTLFYTKKDLLERKNVYLPNDVLSFLCECVFCLETSEIISYFDLINCSIIKNKEHGGRQLEVENLFVDPKRVLIDNLKSMLNNNTLSDIELRTKTKTHLAHKCMLSSRSPVFHAMFSNEMREKIIDYVAIDDLNDDTITRMLQYIYNADVGDLEWVSATELYEAADKYQILTLKDICSFYIKINLRPSNACDALVLADMHQDKDLKSCVQDFVLRHGKCIMNSEEWKQLMKNNINLAAETMHLLYKK